METFGPDLHQTQRTPKCINVLYFLPIKLLFSSMYKITKMNNLGYLTIYLSISDNQGYQKCVLYKEKHECLWATVALIVELNVCMCDCLCQSVCVYSCTCPHCLIVGYNNALERQPLGVLPGCGGPHFFIKNCSPAAEALLHHNVIELYKGKHMRPGANLQTCPNR